MWVRSGSEETGLNRAFLLDKVIYHHSLFPRQSSKPIKRRVRGKSTRQESTSQPAHLAPSQPPSQPDSHPQSHRRSTTTPHHSNLQHPRTHHARLILSSRHSHPLPQPNPHRRTTRPPHATLAHLDHAPHRRLRHAAGVGGYVSQEAIPRGQGSALGSFIHRCEFCYYLRVAGEQRGG